MAFAWMGDKGGYWAQEPGRGSVSCWCYRSSVRVGGDGCSATRAPSHMARTWMDWLGRDSVDSGLEEPEESGFESSKEDNP